jgi:NAD(P)-dependent dehydrogenase (short-subunit alcohol dehydrogenase family)
MDPEGKTVLVTGSARRIGRATILEFARRGARVAVHYNSSESEARETVREIESLGAEVASFRADLARPGEAQDLVEEVLGRFGRLDILVNSASVFAPGSLEDTSEALWDSQMDTNARAPFFLARAAAPGMRERGEGKIINVADPAGESVWPGYFAYSVSKAALLAVTRGLARSLAPEVQVNAVAPGPVQFPDSYSEEQKQAAVRRTLLKRAGTRDDVVRAILFLVENDYVTGEVLHVDGGRHIV